jgi:cyclase
MSKIRIIPSLLLQNKRLVKGSKFKNYINAGNPSTTISALDSQCADEIILIDLDGYIKKKNDYKTLYELSKFCNTPLIYGGGIDTLEKAKLAFDNGADRIYISSVLINKFDIIKKINYIYGEQSIVAGLNLIKNKKNEYEIFRSNQRIDIIEYLQIVKSCGVGEIKITYVNLEGTGKGMDVEFSKYLISKINLPIIFEGGIGNLKHIEIAAKNKINNLAIGSLITFKDYNITKIKQFLFNKKYLVRLS